MCSSRSILYLQVMYYKFVWFIMRLFLLRLLFFLHRMFITFRHRSFHFSIKQNLQQLGNRHYFFCHCIWIGLEMVKNCWATAPSWIQFMNHYHFPTAKLIKRVAKLHFRCMSHEYMYRANICMDSIANASDIHLCAQNVQQVRYFNRI